MDDRTRPRRVLALESERVRLERQDPAIGAQDLELVDRTGLNAGDEDLPDTDLDPFAHRMAAPVPAVEGANDADPPGVRCPHRELHAGDAVEAARMSAELLVEPAVAPLCQEMDVDLAKQRRKLIRIDDVQETAIGFDAQPIAETPRAPGRSGKDAVGMQPCQLAGHLAARMVHDPHPRRPGLEGANDQRTTLLVHAKESKGIAVFGAPQSRHGTLDPGARYRLRR
jgi:hypothetical protein